ncbi:fimbrial protein [Hafnia paralvei]|uniref:fimbrial protein n=1 Tax=Hafnia paralvei TaxID=546367 RepID=UPI000DF36B79|nr:fimbrial protein [Hafnia paralvei]MBU2673304.1 fimbrial protein [Hafnia paralvei]RDA68871.1 fimbrial protein [Hafnia paralvei]RDA69960.1 fimbrial protein [Hafnia paralvei]RDA70037.1 fimbrial protein [Hafnia paralvei]RDA79283.1 fimbrial protein [Hafnia paralvei]
MTLNKAVHLAFSSLLTLLAAGHQGAQAATSASATVTIKATFSSQPCTLTMPSAVHLGGLLNGTQSYNPVKIDINCPTPTNTVIYGEQIGSAMVGGNASRMEMTVPAGVTGTPAQFWLSTEGKEIDLTGDGATDETKGFCAGTDNRSCTLTPSTLVVQDTPRGQTTATIRFNINYV